MITSPIVVSGGQDDVVCGMTFGVDRIIRPGIRGPQRTRPRPALEADASQPSRHRCRVKGDGRGVTNAESTKKRLTAIGYPILLFFGLCSLMQTP